MSSGPDVAPQIVHDVLRSSGRPLEPSTRAFLEPRLGQDLGQVRVHTNQRAAESARAVNALAYTVGRNIVFGDGRYRPGTSAGRRLLSHELAHVAQQRAATGELPTTLAVAPPGGENERAAEAAADAVTSGRAVAVHPMPSASLQRDPDKVGERPETVATHAHVLDGFVKEESGLLDKHLESIDALAWSISLHLGGAAAAAGARPELLFPAPLASLRGDGAGIMREPRPADPTYGNAAVQRSILARQAVPTAPPKAPSIQAGDVVVRAGTFSGKNPLVQIIGEQYNHGGVALTASTVHHVEVNGYETVDVDTFFSPANASGGAVLRFTGPFAAEIRARVVEIAAGGRYKKIPGNPFSTAESLQTVNCNEFVHELYRQAIAEYMTQVQETDPGRFRALVRAYGNPEHAGEVKPLLKAKDVEIGGPGLPAFGPGTAVAAAEAAGQSGITERAKKSGEVKVQFEGRIERRNLYPEEWATSWNPFKSDLYWNKGFYTVAVLRTFTPDSFVNGGHFALVERVAKRT